MIGFWGVEWDAVVVGGEWSGMQRDAEGWDGMGMGWLVGGEWDGGGGGGGGGGICS